MDEPEQVVVEDRLLLRIEEAANRLGIGRSLMYRLVLSGQVQSVPLGRLRRIPWRRCESTSSGCGSKRRASRQRRS